jgi:hypothetical protein
MAWQCERWHCLPDSGGMYEQDYKLTRRMATLSNVYDSVSRWRNLTGERIHHLSDHDRRILRYLLDIGINFNA